jgi:hypothetical protein
MENHLGIKRAIVKRVAIEQSGDDKPSADRFVFRVAQSFTEYERSLH